MIVLIVLWVFLYTANPAQTPCSLQWVCQSCSLFSTCCVISLHKNGLWSKNKSNGELVLMFLNKKRKNLWLRLILFSRGRSSRENVVVWSWSWSCVTVAFIHITGCQWVSLNHSWGGREIFDRAQWAGAKFTCVLFDCFHAVVCSVQVCGLSYQRTCCQIQWPDWSDCLLGSKKSSWVWKCCEFVQWNYTVVVNDYVTRPFEKAFRYVYTYYKLRQRTLHAHMNTWRSKSSWHTRDYFL